MSKSKGPVLIDLDAPAKPVKSDAEPLTPATAPPVPDTQEPLPTGQAMQTLAQLAARRPSRLTRFFWSALIALLGFMASVAAWEFVANLVTSNPILGYVALALLGLFCVALLLVAGREWLALVRLKSIDGLRMDAEAALSTGDLKAARRARDKIVALYKSRPELDAARAVVMQRDGDSFDADALFEVVEQTLLAPLDDAARREVEAAARQVATVTAIVPLALADLIAALTANLRMIRRIADLYGGRSGALGNWRLTKAVMTHLVATGAVAIGDDLIGSIAGGGMLSRISRRFGEGVVNGALTARVGIAAMEVCRPLPFSAAQKPSVTRLVKRALTGLFSTGKD
ncbi:MAG: TIGR01620 family protein [Pseudomonadota bacterium]